MRFAIQGCLLLLGLTACSSSHHARERSQLPPPPPEPYVRVAGNGSNLLQLQIALRELVPHSRRAPAVWLCGVSHIGEQDYYAELQSELDRRTVVLFEGVSAKDTAPRGPNDSAGANEPGSTQSPSGAPSPPTSARGSLQSSLASSLGLVFQLEAIDYTRPNFRNSDLSVQELRDILAEGEQAGQAGAAKSFEAMLQTMEGGSLFNTLLELAFRFVAGSPKLQALGRLALVDLLAEVQGDPSKLQGLDPELKELVNVLVQRRNQKVMTDLATESRQLGRRDSIALFYGAGHMADLESRLCLEEGYRPAREIWLTAFSVDLARARVTESERDMVSSLIKSQLKAAPHTKERN